MFAVRTKLQRICILLQNSVHKKRLQCGQTDLDGKTAVYCSLAFIRMQNWSRRIAFQCWLKHLFPFFTKLMTCNHPTGPRGLWPLQWRQPEKCKLAEQVNPWLIQRTHITQALVYNACRCSSTHDRQLCSSQCECLLPISTPLHHIIPLISSISLWAVVYFRHQMPDEICRRCVLGSNPYK